MILRQVFFLLLIGFAHNAIAQSPISRIKAEAATQDFAAKDYLSAFELYKEVIAIEGPKPLFLWLAGQSAAYAETQMTAINEQDAYLDTAESFLNQLFATGGDSIENFPFYHDALDLSALIIRVKQSLIIKKQSTISANAAAEENFRQNILINGLCSFGPMIGEGSDVNILGYVNVSQLFWLDKEITDNNDLKRPYGTNGNGLSLSGRIAYGTPNSSASSADKTFAFNFTMTASYFNSHFSIGPSVDYLSSNNDSLLAHDPRFPNANYSEWHLGLQFNYPSQIYTGSHQAYFHVLPTSTTGWDRLDYPEEGPYFMFAWYPIGPSYSDRFALSLTYGNEIYIGLRIEDERLPTAPNIFDEDLIFNFTFGFGFDW